MAAKFDVPAMLFSSDLDPIELREAALLGSPRLCTPHLLFFGNETFFGGAVRELWLQYMQPVLGANIEHSSIMTEGKKGGIPTDDCIFLHLKSVRV